jgi:hypothetical protein
LSLAPYGSKPVAPIASRPIFRAAGFARSTAFFTAAKCGPLGGSFDDSDAARPMFRLISYVSNSIHSSRFRIKDSTGCIAFT